MTAALAHHLAPTRPRVSTAREPLVKSRWPVRACALALALGCTTPRTAPTLVSPSAVVLETPLVEQDELYECGLVAVSALCQFWKVALPEEERLALVKTAAESKGLSGAELRDVLERRGLEVYLFQGTLDRGPTGLLHHVERGRPLIVMTVERGDHHYGLFIGFDPDYGNVVLLDPRRGLVALPNATFERLWGAAERFTLLAVPNRTTDRDANGLSAASEPSQTETPIPGEERP